MMSPKICRNEMINAVCAYAPQVGWRRKKIPKIKSDRLDDAIQCGALQHILEQKEAI